MKQAKDLIEGMSGLFAGGTLSEQDKDAVMKALQDIGNQTKRNVEKYTEEIQEDRYGRRGITVCVRFLDGFTLTVST